MQSDAGETSAGTPTHTPIDTHDGQLVLPNPPGEERSHEVGYLLTYRERRASGVSVSQPTVSPLLMSPTIIRIEIPCLSVLRIL